MTDSRRWFCAAARRFRRPTKWSYPSRRPPRPPHHPLATAEPLRVLGYSPQGSDALIGAVRVTFSQPMVPVAMLRTLRAEHVPLEITPAQPGSFRWLGVDTVVFEPDHSRMPMATTFTARVPAGTRSAVGGTLARDVTFSFHTPPLEIVDKLPAASPNVGLRPLIALHFNQRVDAHAVMGELRVTPPAPLDLLTRAEDLASVRAAYPDMGTWEDGRWLALRPRTDLARQTRYFVKLPSGSRGGEGPDPSTHEAVESFQTRGPLVVQSIGCAGDDTPVCTRYTTPRIVVSNPLDPANDLTAVISVSPEVPNLERRITRAGVDLEGEFAPGAVYTATAHSGLRDTFGQTLGSDVTRTFTMEDARPGASVNIDGIATVERGSPHSVPLDVVNVSAVALQSAAVPPDRMLRAADVGAEAQSAPSSGAPFQQLGLSPRSATVEHHRRSQRERAHPFGRITRDPRRFRWLCASRRTRERRPVAGALRSPDAVHRPRSHRDRRPQWGRRTRDVPVDR